jgi:O-antigen/teichoic acid export membrane protein
MAKLKDDRVRQASAFLRTARVLVMAAAPCSIMLALAAPALITLLWRGKWDAAIAPAQVQALSLVVCLLMPASVSLIESQGRWKLRSSLLLLDGLATVLFACMGAYLGGALSIAAWVSGGKVLATFMYCATGGYVLGLSARRVMAEAMPPILIAAAAAVGPMLLMRALPGHLVIGASAALLTFGLLFATGARVLIPNYVVETLNVLRRPTPTSK